MESKVLSVKVIPNSKINKIIEEKDGFLKIKLTAPAHEGKANKSLIIFLSLELKIAKSKIKIVAGEKSREKTISLLI
ncbi:MAG: DUF167 domain-containing protein [Candidatus Parcubacteria bacterium]|nr:DUF167 domain-containing protein [Candidatus Parcubacteria bacterium]